MKNDNKSFGNLTPDPECPTLAWFIAQRVTDPDMELDCTIMITGRKGSGKSLFSVGLGYEIAKEIALKKFRKQLMELPTGARMKKWEELASKYFNMDHVKSVDKEGTMEMFSGDVIMTENAILLCDDVSIAANSRNSMTQQNKAISQIMTVSRPYRNVVILNTVYSTLVDKTARNFSDIVIELLGVNKKRKQSIAKCYLYSVNQNTGKEYKKFFRFNGKRIIYWVSKLPPKHLRDAYKQLRMDKTKELIEGFGQEQVDRREKGTKRAKHADEIINTYKDQVIELYEQGGSIKECVRISPDLSEYWVNKILGSRKRELKNVRKE
jgi:hypothetical protein